MDAAEGVDEGHAHGPLRVRPPGARPVPAGSRPASASPSSMTRRRRRPRRRRRRAGRPARWPRPWPASWWLPCSPALRTWYAPSASSYGATTRTKWILPSGRRRSGSSATAAHVGPVEVVVGVAHHLPQRRPGEQLEATPSTTPGCRAGRTPGRRAVGPAGDGAEGQRLGRLDGDLHPPHVADPVEHDLHEVEVAHAHAAAGEQRVARRRRPRSMAAAMAASSSGMRPRSTPSQPLLGEQRAAG